MTLEITYQIDECAVCKEIINPFKHDTYWNIPVQNTVGSCCIDKVRRKDTPRAKGNWEDYYLITEEDV